MIEEHPTPSPVLVADDGGVRTLRLDRPETRNALNTAMVLALAEALEEAQRDDTVRCVILTGGPRWFASGADLRELLETPPTALLHGDKDAAWKRIFACEKPIVAAVAGPALGGGCELAFASDFVVAADNAVFGQPEIRLGILPGAGGTQRWARTVGRFRAAQVVLGAEQFSAWEAYRGGFVAEVVPGERLAAAAAALAGRIAASAPHAARAAKAALRAAESMALGDALRYEKALLSAVLSTDDANEGVTAFLERRAPVFKGQ
ncbi:enoyl-CoA hydratase-related protein [Salinibacterium sp. ZJ450]|uniref:enoyl-CoA hydratase-related protein n=1 Tax=Salinibacterium sp. ZJ450 TaxID=2708338 RepID=UPI001420EFF3|nr:enoyl-CoA hydratase-related protein [Salinibacterium sp. ZJ450]